MANPSAGESLDITIPFATRCVNCSKGTHACMPNKAAGAARTYTSKCARCTKFRLRGGCVTAEGVATHTQLQEPDSGYDGWSLAVLSAQFGVAKPDGTARAVGASTTTSSRSRANGSSRELLHSSTTRLDGAAKKDEEEKGSINDAAAPDGHDLAQTARAALPAHSSSLNLSALRAALPLPLPQQHHDLTMVASPRPAPDATSAMDSDTPRPIAKVRKGGKKSNRTLQEEEGLVRTDNGLSQTSWPVAELINQKNYYTDYMKRDDNLLSYRVENEANREKLVKAAKDRDRAMNGHVGALASAYDAPASGDEDGFPPNKIIVIHPGSQNLRIGFADDALPKTTSMCIAFRKDKNESEESRYAIPYRRNPNNPPDQKFGPDFKWLYEKFCNDLKIDMRANKRKVLPNSKELVVNYNRRELPEVIPVHNDPVQIEFTDPKSKTVFTGEAAQRLPDNSDPKYSLVWPIRHGWLNEKDFSNRESLNNAIDTILFNAFTTQLGIDRKSELKQYRAVLVIPDLYERVVVEQYLKLFLEEYEFQSVCLIQEAVAATSGAGYTLGCIVDVGAQKTSLACVEDGMIIEDSRINLKYGGADVTETFMRMMLADSFPYSDINLLRRYDFLLAEELKQKFCTMNQAEISVQLYNFHLRAPDEPTRKYQFKTYDEVILAPMGFYEPAIFDLEDKHARRRKLIARSVNAYDPDMPDDPAYSSRAQLAILKSINPSLGQPEGYYVAPGADVSTPAKEKPQFNFMQRLDSNHQNTTGTPGTSNPGSPAPEGNGTPAPFIFSSGFGPVGVTDPGPGFNFEVPGGTCTGGAPIAFTRTPMALAIERDSVLPIAPLDAAIMMSITHATTDPKKQRDFYGAIMVVGGGAKTPGFGPFLEARMKMRMPWLADRGVLVGTSPRDLDGQVVAWKGASVFAKLTTNDAWISKAEWERHGMRSVADRVTWHWN